MESSRSGRRIACALACAALLAAAEAGAGACHDKCGQAYESCGAVEAVGCELGAQLAGQAAEQLASQLPIPGMGALFGGIAKQGTKEACEQKLAPCRKIKETCMAECGPLEGAAPGAAPPAAPVTRATFRVFSDRPRTIVYINGERMGATPQDPLEPYVTPELRVGKYWVHLETPDGEWEWEGAKDVEEGNINAVEGRLESVEEKTFAAAQAIDRQGDAFRAIDAYDAFVNRYPGSAHVAAATARMNELAEQIAAAEKELLSRIRAAKYLEEQIALCEAFLTGFPTSPGRPHVEQVLAKATRTLDEAKRESAAFAAVQAEAAKKESEASLRGIAGTGDAYLSGFPKGPHRAEVEKLVADARERLEALEKEARRKAVGRPQRISGIALMSLGGAAALTGVILGAAALSEYRDLESGCGQTSDGCSETSIDDNHAQAVATNWMLGIGLVSAAGGILLYALAPRAKKESPAVAPSVAPTEGGAVAAITGRF